MKPSQASRDRSGFTLAEIAVTIVIVGIGLVLVLQGLNHSKMTAAHTRNMKLARELGHLTMGQVEAGIYSGACVCDPHARRRRCVPHAC